ncbi:MAG TPA: ABC transporter permease [Candidatus Babeliales bacterium]|nr:ABC transporter permease [Candidatus Babeliales bacterium]
MLPRLKQRLSRQLGFALGAPALLWQLLFLWLPLLCLVALSFTATGNFSDGAWSLAAYRALGNWAHLQVIARSVLLALTTTGLCLLVAYPVAYYLALYTSHRLRRLVLFLLTLPFWINFLVQIYAWFFILERDGLLHQACLALGLPAPGALINNLFATVLVMFHVYLPFMLLPLYTTLEKFNQTLIASALDLGATHWQAFWQITVPLSFSGIRTGFLLVFVMCFGEYAIPILMGGSKTFYVGSLMTEYCLMARNLPQGAALMVLSSLALGLVIGLLSLLARWLMPRPAQDRT